MCFSNSVAMQLTESGTTPLIIFVSSPFCEFFPLAEYFSPGYLGGINIQN